MTFTANEQAIFRGARDNEFANAFDGETPWVFAVIDESGLSPKAARGAIASLIKKDCIEVWNCGQDTVLSLTAIGLRLAAELD